MSRKLNFSYFKIQVCNKQCMSQKQSLLLGLMVCTQPDLLISFELGWNPDSDAIKGFKTFKHSKVFNVIACENSSNKESFPEYHFKFFLFVLVIVFTLRNNYIFVILGVDSYAALYNVNPSLVSASIGTDIHS